MKLRDLITETPYVLETRGDMDTEILEITSGSRDKTTSGLFFCIVGARFDAHDYAFEAVEMNLISSSGATTIELQAPSGATLLLVENQAAEATAEPEVPAVVSYDSDAPIGHEVGQQLEDFTLTCYDGSEFHLAEQRGKVTIINFWATSCVPCKAELPFFSELYKAHEGDIAMVAVHMSLVTDDPEEYLADKGYAMPFATDDDDDTVLDIVGGNGTMPQTVVLNRRGEVIYNKIGSVTRELLDALYDEADAA